VSFAAAVTAYVAIPFAGGDYPWIAQRVNTGVFFVIAVLGLEVFGVILAGYSSASKWSLFGAMREAAQVVSYEVPLGMCAVVPVLLAGSMDLVVIGDHQAGWFFNWYLFNDPATFIVFWVYFTCATASVNRAPFDLAEAESELVAGFHTEYSGLRWSFFFMAVYGSMLTVSLLASILFLGGWHGPIPITELLGLQSGGWFEGMAGSWWSHVVCQSLGVLNVLAKGFIGVSVMMWVRWTLPRLRIDQVMTTCLKYCTPISAVMFLGAALWHFWLPQRNFFGLTAARAESYAVSEGWPGPGVSAAAADTEPIADDPAHTPSTENGGEDSDESAVDATATRDDSLRLDSSAALGMTEAGRAASPAALAATAVERAD
jgi:NADH-quinone oxidoreductase subunit H